MIVVLADDLSGAAEMGGMAWRYGLSADVMTVHDAGGLARGVGLDGCGVRLVDVLVIDTDSRACSASEAVQKIHRAAELCKGIPVEWVFKKVDSVLRGNVVAELGALLGNLDHQRSLLIPADPALGRTIERGRYLVDGRPLHETDFANDPEFPALTACVVDLLIQRDELGMARRWPISVVSSDQRLPDQGIFVGETSSLADLAVWAQAIPADTLASGAVDFFGALLEERGRCIVQQPAYNLDGDTNGVKLFVCGSTSARSRRFCQSAEAQDVPVLRLPPDLLVIPDQAQHLLSAWAMAAVDALRAHPTVIIAIDRPLRREPDLPQRLTEYLGATVAAILERAPVEHLLVEGGATAAALIRRFDWRRLHVLRELSPGAVSVQVDGMDNFVLTMKPGSYPWPEEIAQG